MIRSAAIKGYLLVTGMRDAQQLQAEVPDSQLVTSPKTGASILALPHTLAGATRLSRLGIDAPSPILSEYVWTGRFPPYAHQRVTSDFMTKNPKCIVLSDMATGKTASAMWAADYLMKIGAIRTVLVLSPLSCVNRVWMDELFKWIPHRAGTVVRGGRDRRKRMARESQSPFLILNHDGLKVVAKEIIQRGDIDLIIVDEASVIRNAETARYRLFVQVAAATRARLWLLTGTPTPNAPTDAWALGRLINREGTHWSFKKFRNHTMIKISQFRWVAKKEAKIIVRNVLQPGIRFKKSECLDLPETVPIFRECAMSKEQTKAYKEMLKHLITQGQDAKGTGKIITAINAAGKLNKLAQICQGSVYAEDGSIIDLPLGDRLDVTCNLIDASLSKSIVFVPYRHVCDRVQRELEARGYGVIVIHGGVTGGKRDALIQKFQIDSGVTVMIAHPRTAAHGLNLQVASTTVWYGPTFSAEQYEQANERMARTGQPHKMTIAHLSSMPVEDGIYDVLHKKTSRQAAILKLYENVLTK